MIEPKVSIITVTFNARELLQKTIESVKSQSYKNIEYIVIDGASTDGTPDVIKKHLHNPVTNYLSEPDKGLYDAMNKGLRMASGDYIWFMNAGDEIYSETTLSDIFKNESQPADVYFGNAMIIDSSGSEIGYRRLQPPDNVTWKSLKRGMVICHQSFLVRRSVCGFYQTENYKLAADIDWMISSLKNSKKIVNTHLILSRFLEGGLSRQKVVSGLQERFRIMTDHYGLFSTLINHIPLGFNFLVYLVRHKRF